MCVTVSVTTTLQGPNAEADVHISELYTVTVQSARFTMSMMVWIAFSSICARNMTASFNLLQC